MHAAIYTRVSTKDQIEGTSLESQQRDCRLYAEKRGWTVTEVYEDPGISGRKEDRPAFNRLRADASHRPRPFDVVLVWKFDRCARNTALQLRVIDEFAALGIALISITEPIEHDTATGRFNLTMVSASAEFLARLTGERVARARRSAAEHGKAVGPVPFGYQRNINGVLEPTDDAPVVQLAFALYATGQHSNTSIADELNRLGHRMFNIQRQERVLFGKFAIREMLQNSTYRGLVHLKGQEYQGQHEPLVSAEVWDQVQAIRASRARKGQVSVRNGFGILTEIVSCAQCGARMWHQSKIDRPYYCCSSRHRRTCAAPFVRGEFIEEQVLQLVNVLALPDDWIVDVIRLAQQLERQRRPRPPVVVDSEKISAQLVRLKKLYIAGDVSDMEYAQEKAALTAQQSATAVQGPAPLDFSQAAMVLQDLPTLLHNASVVKRRALLRQVFTELWIDRDGIVAITPTLNYAPLVVGVMRYRKGAGFPPGSPYIADLPPVWIAYQQPWQAFAF